MKASAKTYVQSVSRACLMLQLLGVQRDGLSSVEVGRQLGLNRSTAHHILATLQIHGMVVQDADGRFRIGPVLAEMAYGNTDIVMRNLAHGILLDVVEKTGETTYLSLFGPSGVNTIDTVLGVGSLKVVQADQGSGQPAYLHSRASGKLYLSTLSDQALQDYVLANPLTPRTKHTLVELESLRHELARIRTQGFARDAQEFEIGILCYSHPLRVDGAMVGCLSISFPSARDEKRTMYEQTVKNAVQSLQTLLERAGPQLVDNLRRDLVPTR